MWINITKNSEYERTLRKVVDVLECESKQISVAKSGWLWVGIVECSLISCMYF